MPGGDDIPEPPPPEQVITTTGPTPESQRPPSTSSYEDAVSVPEQLDTHDSRAHLTDAQLTGPMHDVPNRCRLPKRAHVQCKVAVQNGRAIGVSVNVTWDKPPGKQRPPSINAVRAENKASAKITTCVDRTVRTIVWPPSSRRDSFTTSF